MPNAKEITDAKSRRWPSARLWIPLVLAGLAAATLFGGRHAARLVAGGGNYMVTGYDVLAQPGKEFRIRMKFERGSLLGDVKDMTVRLQIGEMAPVTCRTDDQGEVNQKMTTFVRGDYKVTGRAEDWFYSGSPSKGPPGLVMAFVRTPETRLAICDIDHTLADISGAKVLVTPNDRTPPLPGSVEVMGRLAQTHLIVYLTARDEKLSNKTRAWLGLHGYPVGPVLFWDFGHDPLSHEKYKTAEIQRLKRDWPNIDYGFGDRDEDARAYAAGGVKSFIVGAVRQDGLPDLATPVADWTRIGELLWAEGSR